MTDMSSCVIGLFGPLHDVIDLPGSSGDSMTPKCSSNSASLARNCSGSASTPIAESQRCIRRRLYSSTRSSMALPSASSSLSLFLSRSLSILKPLSMKPGRGSSALAERDAAARASSAYSMRHALSRDDSSNSSSTATLSIAFICSSSSALCLIASASANRAILRIRTIFVTSSAFAPVGSMCIAGIARSRTASMSDCSTPSCESLLVRTESRDMNVMSESCLKWPFERS